ncbi:twin-arginine translocase subunit TatB [Acinetobacter sp. ANC 4558]|uniref:twin-arginine translocase subunit TatB n=1 Tax=Acinetobacter sp. ANC 4558 TaxID=1977876 RepID=UPI000A350030|nr:twin-arginine translocase subunit TatB [Acinetobacter sp. ANC 4558]OTG84155.1 twin-arginine translocase subunit TatB [Acinetobacter sp. ANC 4558]
MFNISFGEILFLGIIALIILGPEKLLQTLSSIFVKYRKLKIQIDKIQTDLENELELIELKKMMQVELQKIKESEAELKQQLNLMQQELENVQTLHVREHYPKTSHLYYQFYANIAQLNVPFISKFSI